MEKSSAKYSKAIETVSSEVLNGKTRMRNTMFVYEWTIENLGSFLGRKYEISSPIFCTNSKDGTEWKLVMFERHKYPKGPYIIVSLVKVSNDMNPVGVKYSISIGSPKNVQLMQTKENNFKHRFDFDECEVIGISEISKHEFLMDNTLIIRCEMDILHVEGPPRDNTQFCRSPDMCADNQDFRSRCSPNMNSASSQKKVINKFSDSYNILDEESDEIVKSQKKQSTVKEEDSIDELLTDFESLLTRKLFSDITLVCAGTPVSAHRAVLSARSDYFKRICDEKANSSGNIVIPDVKSSVMEAVLYYMYTGKARYLKVDFALDLYSASKKFNLSKLQGLLLDFLKSNINVKNVTEILLACENLNLLDLKYACLKFVNSNKSEMVKSEKWNWLIENNPHIAGEVLLTIASFQKRNVL